MHELSIARSIADVALRHAGGRQVLGVELKVGALRQVVPDALAFAWQMVTPETALEGAQLDLIEVSAAGVCRACAARSTFDDFPFACDACGSLDVDVVAGEELTVEALELGEDACGSLDVDVATATMEALKLSEGARCTAPGSVS